MAMNRKDFLQKSLLGGLGIFMSRQALQAADNDELDFTQFAEPADFQQVGFEHLPYNPNQTDMETSLKPNMILHKSETRGTADLGWLKSRHTFSFSNYYHPQRVQFGALRVLNDDIVAAGMGFGTHPHENMEIVSIPLEGDLSHRDSTGTVATIRQGDIQIMSAGTGIQHSEMNHSKDKQVKFLQIWILPKNRNISPRYDQKTFSKKARQNNFQLIVSPNHKDAVWINQDAFFSLADFESGFEKTYTLYDSAHGVYLFVLSGSLEVEGQTLAERDGFGIWQVSSLKIKATEKASFLIMEVPIS